MLLHGGPRRGQGRPDRLCGLLHGLALQQGAPLQHRHLRKQRGTGRHPGAGYRRGAGDATPRKEAEKALLPHKGTGAGPGQQRRHQGPHQQPQGPRRYAVGHGCFQRGAPVRELRQHHGVRHRPGQGSRAAGGHLHLQRRGERRPPGRLPGAGPPHPVRRRRGRRFPALHLLPGKQRPGARPGQLDHGQPVPCLYAPPAKGDRGRVQGLAAQPRGKHQLYHQADGGAGRQEGAGRHRLREGQGHQPPPARPDRVELHSGHRLCRADRLGRRQPAFPPGRAAVRHQPRLDMPGRQDPAQDQGPLAGLGGGGALHLRGRRQHPPAAAGGLYPAGRRPVQHRRGGDG